MADDEHDRSVHAVLEPLYGHQGSRVFHKACFLRFLILAVGTYLVQVGLGRLADRGLILSRYPEWLEGGQKNWHTATWQGIS